MHHSPGLASSLAMQAYLRHHGAPVCLHELLVQAVRRQCQRQDTSRLAIPTHHADAAPSGTTPEGPAAPSPA